MQKLKNDLNIKIQLLIKFLSFTEIMVKIKCLYVLKI